MIIEDFGESFVCSTLFSCFYLAIVYLFSLIFHLFAMFFESVFDYEDDENCPCGFMIYLML